MTIFAETAIQSTTQQNVSTEQNVCALMLGDENVIGAKCFFYQNSCLVAMLTKPFYLKSQRDEFLKNTQEFLSKELSLDVVATLDVDVYRKIKPDMSNEQKSRDFANRAATNKIKVFQITSYKIALKLPSFAKIEEAISKRFD